MTYSKITSADTNGTYTMREVTGGTDVMVDVCNTSLEIGGLDRGNIVVSGTNGGGKVYTIKEEISGTTITTYI